MRVESFLFAVVLGLALPLPLTAGPIAQPHVYGNGTVLASKLGSDLYQSLEPKFQTCVRPNPVILQNTDTPLITPVAESDGDQSGGGVSLSAGYIDLVNHLAHAKAIDHIQPGYFSSYVLNVARATGSNALPDLPNIVDNRYWTIDVMNEQASYFNQMIGVSLAINLSYHYLGAYHQFSRKMTAGKLVPITNFIPPNDWDTDIKAAVLNCMNCALAMNGAQALFQAIDSMPNRPEWAAYIVPPNTDLKSLATQLAQYENMYFHGQLK